MVDCSEHDLETKSWLMDLDNFGKPPPRRCLSGVNRPRSVMDTETYSPLTDHENSPVGGYLSDFDVGIYEGDPADLVNNVQFMQKVRKFQQNTAHPYANKQRVETTKKIALEGGTKGSAGLLMEKPSKISKEEVVALTENVRRSGRPMNPWADKTQSVEKNYVLPTSTKSPPPPPPHPPTKIDTGSTFDTRSIGTASSSAYSSFSSVGGSLDMSVPMDRRKVSQTQSTDSSLTVVDKHTSAYDRPLNISTIQSNPSSQLGRKHNSSILADNQNQDCATYQNLPGPPSPRTLKPAESPVESDPDYIRLFEDFETDLQKLSRRSRSKTPETNGHYPPPCDPPIHNRVKHNNNNIFHAHPVETNDKRPQRIAIPPPGTYVPPQSYSSRTTPARPSYLQHQQRQLSSGGSSGFTSPASSAMPSPNPTNSTGSFNVSPQSNVLLRRDDLWRSDRKRDIIADRIPPGETVIPSPIHLRRPAGNMKFKPQMRSPEGTRYSAHLAPNVDDTPPTSYGRSNQFNPGPFASKFANANEKSKVPPLSTRSQSASCLGKGQPSNMAVPITSSPLPWRRSSTSGSVQALRSQQEKYEQLQEQVAKQLQENESVHGTCHKCNLQVTNVLEATQGLGNLYHSQCFTCDSCGRPLKGKRFYEAGGKIYCEEDYLYSGFQQSAERCHGCGHLIMEMILQAVGKAWHPDCFRCVECKKCLDGIPFTVDKEGKVYCVIDYHKKFAPTCAKCLLAITPVIGSDETVRVHAMNSDYHIECYICEGCNLQLTDEPAKRCYPLGTHLLCQICHMHWSRTGSAQDPVTDV